ncbi:MAG: DUF4389 domain-containing protein [Solirubrobacterales bacterium]|nr:DUF4389 domain-containing protein [Solirubrobacterales bacterium]
MYPVTYEADYLRERNRWSTFFRLIVAIPWLIVQYVYSIAQLVIVVVAWFAILILGRFPDGMYNFVGGVLRFNMRVNGFVYLQTDAWPPFGIGEDPGYPIRVNFYPPAGRQSRVKTLFRIILLIPIAVLSYAMSFALMGVTLISWLTIVFRGYQPAAIHNALAYLMGWSTRTSAYAALMRDEYPPVGDETPVEIDPPAEALAPGYDPTPIDPAPTSEEQPPPPAG